MNLPGQTVVGRAIGCNVTFLRAAFAVGWVCITFFMYGEKRREMKWITFEQEIKSFPPPHLPSLKCPFLSLTSSAILVPQLLKSYQRPLTNKLQMPPKKTLRQLISSIVPFLWALTSGVFRTEVPQTSRKSLSRLGVPPALSLLRLLLFLLFPPSQLFFKYPWTLVPEEHWGTKDELSSPRVYACCSNAGLDFSKITRVPQAKNQIFWSLF